MGLGRSHIRRQERILPSSTQGEPIRQLKRKRLVDRFFLPEHESGFQMSTASIAAPAALPFAEDFEECFSNFRSCYQTPRNRALLESAWRTPEKDLKAIADFFELAGEGWDRENGQLEKLVWDAFIEGENSSYGRKFEAMVLFAELKRPGDVTEDGVEIKD